MGERVFKIPESKAETLSPKSDSACAGVEVWLGFLEFQSLPLGFESACRLGV